VSARAAPDFIEPMLARLSTLPADDSGWAFEVKWDGVRAITRAGPGHLRITSRNGNEITGAYPELAGLSSALGDHEAVLDGEIVALDERGRPSFQALQRRMHRRDGVAVKRLAASEPVTYMIFDLLWLDGDSMIGRPYRERRATLDTLELEGERWRVPEYHRGEGAAFLAATRELGLEGVVAKRLDSRYAPGRRTGWAKIKNSRRQEFIVGGWTAGQGARRGSFGALALGVHSDDGKLRFVGSVGTGFDAEELSRLSALLAERARRTSPFSGRQPPKGTSWVEPSLVCEVEFSEWTHAGTIRQPSYKGLREDKPAVQVVRERVDAGSGEVVRERVDAGSGEVAKRAASPGETLEQARAAFGRLIDSGTRARGGVVIEIEGRTLKLSNPEKVMYPATGFTKLDLISYYAAVAPALLPHLRDRPLTLKRYPDGVQGEFFYEKRSPAHRPDWVRTASVASGRAQRDIPYTLCQDLPTLIWLANLADIELHPLLSLADTVTRPTTLAFDLDPGPPAGIVECCEVALELRELLDGLRLASYAKTSGSKGLQVYVPINDRETGYERTKPFARAVASMFEERRPELVVSEMKKAKRPGKVLIDWSQNDAHKTTVSVYSMRATERPSVSTPVQWPEVKECRDHGQAELLSFTPAQTLTRLAEHGDLFSGVLSKRQTLPMLED
jgi:bifunctional non-homologous end joining protein LigD